MMQTYKVIWKKAQDGAYADRHVNEFHHFAICSVNTNLLSSTRQNLWFPYMLTANFVENTLNIFCSLNCPWPTDVNM